MSMRCTTKNSFSPVLDANRAPDANCVLLHPMFRKNSERPRSKNSK
uniref:Uncharacterized protein n=1 Tax=Bartonella schoenbuchensis (strain DSM 13525 / NCTC 13165 / R1) TaxID=687861 RepID=E6Z1J1_BARSR|nr:hypothetical protein BARSC_190252 [Bartonella schoenbuchensis R1]